MPAFKTVAIVGAGTMGHALALVHAAAGCGVRLYDSAPEQMKRAESLIANALDTLTVAGTVPASQRGAILDRIVTLTDLAETVRPADLIVEAVVEDVDVKRQVFADIDAAARADAVIASNTSHLDVFPLIPQGRQRRAAIAHWYTPPYVIDLVDLAPGPQTDPDILPALEAFYAGMGKRPVVFQSLVPGYVANRLQAAIALEVADLLDRGVATPQMIDDSIRHGLALRMVLHGHLKKQDYGGLDMSRRALANGVYRPPQPRGYCETLNRLLEAGRTGVLSGAGYYDYSGAKPEDLLRARDLNLLRLKAMQHDIDEQENEA